jgi:hypothetical protein
MEGKGGSVQGRRAAISLIVFVFTAVFPQLPALAANVTIQWDPSPDTSVVGYNFYYGVASRTYTNIIDVGNATTVTVSNLVPGNTYYFAATAYNVLGTESVFSDELSYTVPLAVNNPPTLNTIGNLTIAEDAVAQTVNLSGISSGATNETQTLSIVATSSNPGLIPNPTISYTSPNTAGMLNFTPVANANGTATITVTVNDGQSQNNTLSRTFTVAVNAVNDLPTLNAINNLSLSESAGLQTVALVGISSGAANENQTLTVSATSSNPALIPNPTVAYTSPNATGSLSFTPAVGGSGTATVTVTVNDGQSQNNIVTRTFVVGVNAVNDPPTLNAIGNVTLNEDAAAQTVNLAGITSGSASETQTLTVTATSSNPGLIANPTVNYTSPSTTGSLAFTPVANASGSATISVRVDDGQATSNTVTRTFTVTVNAVNDTPTLDVLSSATLNEDAGAQTVNLTGIGTGAANETQSLTVTATSSNPGLIPNPTVAYTSPNATGSLSYTPAANASGTATITVTVNDGQAQSNTQSRTFAVTVNAVNDPPTLNPIGNLSLNENAGLQTVALAGIGTGAGNESQTLSISATSSNPGLIPNPTVNYTSPNSTGTLTFTPAANSVGTATVTVIVNDGQTQNNASSRTFTISVNDINDPPTLNALSNLALNEDAGLQTVSLSGISSGAANESQSLLVTATSSNPNLIPNPTVAYTSPNTSGILSFTPAANASGTTVLTVTVNDGQAQSNTVSRSFTVTVNAVNDPPTLNPLSNLTFNEDAGGQTVSLSGISAGVTNENQTLTVTVTSSNPGLIPNPALNYTSPNSTGLLSFTPVAEAGGTATITVTVNDGQSQNNTLSRTFTVTVNPVNDPPTLNAIGNRILSEDASTQTVNLSGITSGATNEPQTLTIAATSSNPGLIPNPTVSYVSPNTAGTLTFTPAANASGGATINVTVNDGQTQLIRTFTVTVNAVNDSPSLDAISNISLTEDAPEQVVNLSGIGSGAANEDQALVVTATSSNPALIPNPSVNYASPNAAGSLTLTPMAEMSGTATITVAINDGDTQNNIFSRTFTVVVSNVNDPPTLNPLGNLSLNENAGQQTVSLTGISSGATNEFQTLTVIASSSNPALIPNPTVTYASPGTSGTLTFIPAAGGSGTATISVIVNDGQAQTTRTFVVGVNAVNDQPTLNGISNVTINEDSGSQTVNLTGIGSGSVTEVQPLTVTAISSNPTLVPNPTVNYASPNVAGSLVFTPIANANGSATITVVVDDGQATNNSISRVFTITVNPVNDSPTLNAVGNITISEDGSAQTVNLSGIGSGAANENQTLTVTATSSNPGLIPNPTVGYTSPNAGGTLEFAPVANANGTATITVTVNDGQAQNNTVVRTFVVTVNAVNDAPTLNPINDVFMNENAGVQTVQLTGIGTGASTENQVLTITAVSSNPGLIPNPVVNYSSPNPAGSLTFTPTTDSDGTATITVTVNDGAAQNNTTTRTFVVTVNPVNQPPTISAITNVVIVQGTPMAPVPFAVRDVETDASALTLQAFSSNPLIVPSSGITFGGSGSNRTVSITPLPDRNGETEITITVSDGQAIATRTFFAIVVTAPLPPTTLTVVTNGDGSVSGAPASANVKAGQVFTLTAVSGEGQMFTGWSGSTNSLSPTLVVKARTNMLLKANFVPLNLTMNGNGTLTPNLKKTRNLIAGKIYTVRAAGGPGNMFISWSGSTNTTSPSVTFVMSTNLNLQANFAPARLTVNGSGTLTPDLRKTPNLIPGQVYTLRAMPSVGYEFAGWSGSVESSLSSLSVVLSPNLSLEANFIPSPYIPIAGTYSGLYYEPEQVRRHSSGFFNVVVTSRGTYSGWLQSAFTRYSFAGKLPLDLRHTNIVTHRLTLRMKLELDFSLAALDDQVVGRWEESTWSCTLSGDRNVFNTRNNPAPYAGNYTLVFPGQAGSPLLPAGDGFGTLRVMPSGQMTLGGTLGDGTRVMQSTWVSRHGNWPLHALLAYTRERGALLGWMNFADRPGDDLSGTLIWTKPGTVLDRYYQGGFNTLFEASGSIYRAPVGPQTNYVLNLTEARVEFSGGNLATAFTNSILLGPYSKVINLSGNPLMLAFSPTLGTYSGSVTDPITLKSFPFKGAVLQKQNAGFGFLTGTDQTSRVVIKAP